MIKDHDTFIAAIHAKTKIRVTFFSKEDGLNLVRVCAPLDYGPFRRATDQSKNYYHFWDYESDKKNHNLPIYHDRIISLQFLEDRFLPSEFVTWASCKWFIVRDWGQHS
ncbi:hypothetical protein GS399_05115 [Pedobacter sp. HMF7647]|uniref:WYL domain-containing protein n=1 Tax=Hufsiella arboris TaxID=2695275 RepID=A0A7K1Y703_9SPHI|nr:hypothetical protein [Hufsiella arboris]MXV50344.1 hypothetical protein [Hufsiella arboris]